MLPTGGIKRWGFARGNMTHGSKSKREHGSTGPGSTPGRVFPGLKAAGQMGNVRAKLRKVEVSTPGGQACAGLRQLQYPWWRWAGVLGASLVHEVPVLARRAVRSPGETDWEGSAAYSRGRRQGQGQCTAVTRG